MRSLSRRYPPTWKVGFLDLALPTFLPYMCLCAFFDGHVCFDVASGLLTVVVLCFLPFLLTYLGCMLFLFSYVSLLVFGACPVCVCILFSLNSFEKLLTLLVYVNMDCGRRLCNLLRHSYALVLVVAKNIAINA